MSEDHGRPSKLAQQYGGMHATGWVDRLPSSWIPFVQLARLSPPVGVCLVLFPHVFGFLHGIMLIGRESHRPSAVDPPPEPARLSPWSYIPAWMALILEDWSATSPPDSALQPKAEQLIGSFNCLMVIITLIGGSFFFSNAIHGWNDLVDAPYDALVARTKGRPIVRGAVSKLGAFIFTSSQGIAGVLLLFLILPDMELIVRIGMPSVVLNLYYPYAKRHTHFAQYVLGLCLGWGVVVGTAAVLYAAQAQSFATLWDGARWESTICLTLASTLWTVIYDTVYACQDKDDDMKVGLKSTAVLFGEHTKMFLLVNLGLLISLLAQIGRLNGCGNLYFLMTVAGCLCSLGTLILKVDLHSSSSCWWWFRYGFWFAGACVATGLSTSVLEDLL